jgi:hypothetical protein
MDAQSFYVLMGTARRIWLQRNDFIHGGVFTHPAEIMKRAKAVILDFQKARDNASPDNAVDRTCG